MKYIILASALLLGPVVGWAQRPGAPPTPSPLRSTPRPLVRARSPIPSKNVTPGAARQQQAAEAAMGDIAGGRQIPKIILGILGKRTLDPVTAYILFQAARHPINDWTIKQLEQITAILPTLAESGLSPLEMQLLYRFYDLDANNLFNPIVFGGSWQMRSMIFDPHYGATPTSISSAECAQNFWVMTVGVYKACFLQPRK